MMRTTRRYGGLPLFVAFVVAGCGGVVPGFGTKGDGGPSSCGTGSCPPNPGDDVVGDDEIPSDGGPVEDGGPPVNPSCASGAPIGSGFACGPSGLVCPLGTVSDCNGNTRTLNCSCDGSTWTCDPVPELNCPAPVPCPDPSTLYPGDSCYGAEGQHCISTDIPAFTCNSDTPPPTKGLCVCTMGSWSCPTTTPSCPAQPPACPDPFSVYASESCPAEGMKCPGNPQPCGAEVFYDAFDCEGGYWVSVATTACDVDASTGLIFDASAGPDAQVVGFDL